MTDKPRVRRRLSLEILGIFAVCFAIALALFLFLTFFTVAAVEELCMSLDITLTEDMLYGLDNTVITASLIISAALFAVLFFAMFGERLAYIRTIIGGVNALQRGELDHRVPLQGHNELTDLAGSVNYLAQSEQTLREREQLLAEQKEDLIRALSHDIRTPLTSVMSYTELMRAKPDATPEELVAYYDLVGRKTAQIKELTDILLDAGKREVEHFEDAGLLFVQLADEFEEMLEGEFEVKANLSMPAGMGGSFDVQELQRIFDNLISNVQKYANPQSPVQLDVSLSPHGLVIAQKNAIKAAQSAEEGYRMGIHSMRRIAQNYGGSVEITKTEQEFLITVTLPGI